MRSLVLAVLAALCVADTLPAQGRPLRVTPRQDIAFGAVFPGVPTTIAPTDVARSAQFEITGRKDSQVVIVFTLPSALVGPTGTPMPITFGPASAAYSANGSAANAVSFDPRVPFTITLPTNGRGTVYLGGTLLPSGAQPSGAYGAGITLSIASVDL